MKSIFVIVMILISTAALAGTKEEAQVTEASEARPAHKLTIDLDKLALATKDISLLQPVIRIVKWVSRPEQVQLVRKQKSYFI